MKLTQLPILLLGLLVMSLSLTIVAQDSNDDPIRLGAIFDIAEPETEQGRAFAEGILGYVEWLNANGGINDRPVELLAQDMSSSGDTIETVYDEFVSQGIVGLVGWRTIDTELLQPQLVADQLPIIFFEDKSNTQLETIPFHYIITPSVETQFTQLLSTLQTQWMTDGNSLLNMSVVLFHNDSSYGMRPISIGEQFAIDTRSNFEAIPMLADADNYILDLQRADDLAVTHIIIHSDAQSASLLAQDTADFFGNPDFYQLACTAWCSTDTFIELVGDNVENTLGVTVTRVNNTDTETIMTIQDYLGSPELLEIAGQHYVEGWLTTSVLVEAIQRTLDANLELIGSNINATLEQFDDNPYMSDGFIAPTIFSPDNHYAFTEMSISILQEEQWQPFSIASTTEE